MDSEDNSENIAVIGRYERYSELSESDDEIAGHADRMSYVASMPRSSSLRATAHSHSARSCPTEAIIRALAESPAIDDFFVDDEREHGNQDSITSPPVLAAATRTSSACQTDMWNGPSHVAPLQQADARGRIALQQSPLSLAQVSRNVSPEGLVDENVAPAMATAPPHVPVRHSLVSQFSHMLPSQPQLFSLPTLSLRQPRPQSVHSASETKAAAAATAAATAPRSQSFESPAMRRLQDEIMAIRQLASRPALGATWN
jgi:hypothetical protein